MSRKSRGRKEGRKSSRGRMIEVEGEGTGALG